MSGFSGEDQTWIAEVFNVDVRSVKAARRHLMDINWLAKISGQGGPVCKRWGGEVTLRIDVMPSASAGE